MRQLVLENETAKNRILAHGLDWLGILEKALSPWPRLGTRITLSLGARVARRFPPRDMCTVQLNSDSRFGFFLADPYWNRLVSSYFEYEMEIKTALKMLRSLDYGFVDCGANYGYWSILASSLEYGSHPTVAVEPVKDNFQILQRNRDLNRNRFAAVKKAVWSNSGQTMGIHVWGGLALAGSSLLRKAPDQRVTENPDSALVEQVETITTDDLVEEYLGWQRPLLVKLDVEDAENEALMGSRRILAEQSLFIYEDHARDIKSTLTGVVLSLGLKVAYLDKDRVVAVSRPEQATALKKVPGIGYNFFAYRPKSIFDDIFASYIDKSVLAAG